MDEIDVVVEAAEKEVGLKTASYSIGLRPP